jgi:hypothetical protein
MHSDANRRASIELLHNFGYTVATVCGDHLLATAPAHASVVNPPR